MDDFNQSVLGKLDDIIERQTDVVSRITRVEAAVSRLPDVEREVLELKNTVRGFNGHPGLVADVYYMKNRMMELHPAGGDSEKKKDRDQSQFVSWQWVIDKVSVPLIMGFLFWILFDVLPKLLNGGY